MRLVHDCAAKFGQTSLVVGDIKASFTNSWWTQKIVTLLRSKKRFVWWPSRDLAKEMQEYRMVKHLFSATSLPSVANFCPRKTAQLNQEGFDAKVEATVKQGRSQTSEQDEASFER